MYLPDLTRCLAILSTYADFVEMDYVPNSFANGTPNHPFQSELWLNVPVDHDLPEADAAFLRARGWHTEQEGQYWCLRQLRATQAVAVLAKQLSTP